MKLKYILISCLVFIGFAGCDDFEDVNTDPNATNKVTPQMLATNLIQKITDVSSTKGFMRDEMLAKYVSWTEAQDIDIAFNLLGTYGFGDLENLRNAQKMVDLANESDKDVYTAFYHFSRAFFFFNVTMRVGDIPYSEALQGEDGIYFPKYDSQKSIFLGLLNELDKADELFSKGGDFQGDYIYGGDTEKWRMATNVLELRLLLNLYKKVDDPDLKVKERINNIVNNRPLFESIEDNMQVIYSNKAGQKYPYNKETNSFIVYDRLSDIFINKMKDLEDYRMFYYAKPTKNAQEASADPSDWNSYGGVNPVLPEAEILQYDSKGDVSQINDRYEELPEGEPIFLLSYQEMNFMLAEMVIRNLIPGNAKAYYEEGIRSSMQFVAKYTPDDPKYNHDRKITDQYIAEYLQHDGVKFATDFNKQLEQIIWQKYIMNFLQTPYNSFFEYRRTGFPVFPINPKSNRNIPSDKMPLRWMYSESELNYNRENVTAAINEQYGGSDDYMGVMWILK